MCCKDCRAEGLIRNRTDSPKSKLYRSTFEPFNSKKIICSPRQKVQAELDGLKKELNSLSEKAEEVLASPQQASSSPVLRSELDITLKKMEHVYGLSSIYLDK